MEGSRKGVNAAENKTRHRIIFPEELPRRLIRMFSFSGDTVLDPFLGSGTTALAAKRLQRYSVGYEINADYSPKVREEGVEVGNILALDRQVKRSRLNLSFKYL